MRVSHIYAIGENPPPRYLAGMKETQEKSLVSELSATTALAVAPGPFSRDTIRSLLAQHKSIRSAYFFFDGYRVMPQCNSLVARAGLMQQELLRRGLKFKRLLFTKVSPNDQTSPVGLLVFSIDQQAARRLCALFTPDESFWCDRVGPEIPLA